MGSLTLSIELDGGKIVDTACLSMSCGSPWGPFRYDHPNRLLKVPCYSLHLLLFRLAYSSGAAHASSQPPHNAAPRLCRHPFCQLRGERAGRTPRRPATQFHRGSIRIQPLWRPNQSSGRAARS